MSYQEVSPQVVTAVNQDTSCKDCGSFAQSKHYIVQYHTLDIEKRIKLGVTVHLLSSGTETTSWKIKVLSLALLGVVLHPPVSGNLSFLSLFHNYEIPEEKAPNEAEDKDDEAKNNDLAIIGVKILFYIHEDGFNWC